MPVTCPKCHSVSDRPDSRFCQNCGAPLPVAEAAAQVRSEVNVGENAGGTVIGVNIVNPSGAVIIAGEASAEAALRRDLRVLLHKVRDFWIKGVLERSVEGAVLIPLNKSTCPGAVTSPLAGDLPVEAAAAPARETQAEYIDLLAESGNALLIMDGVGSGKTTALLTLARQSIQRAEADPLAPVPVILNLANWTGEQPSMAHWILQELSVKYQIPPETGRAWLTGNRLALMLDGLDEVGPGQLEHCIAAINRFRETNGLAPIAIAGRTQVYQMAQDRLRLGQAVQLEPLTDEQIEMYLDAGQPGTAALREVLRADPDLREMAHSPQMLSMMRLAYGGVSPEAIRSEALDTREERRAHLLAAYAGQMFDQYARGAKHPASPAVDLGRFRRFLGALARGMAKGGQSIFMVELLQPAWLTGAVSTWAYWLGTRTLPALLIGLVLAGTAQVAGTTRGRLAYLGASLLAGLLAGLLDRWWMSPARAAAARPRLHGWAYFLAAGLLGALSYGLFFGLIVPAGGETSRLMGGAALVFGVLFGLTGKDRLRGEDIQPAQRISWSWRQVRRGLPAAALIAAAVLLGILINFRGFNEPGVWLFGAVYAVISLLGILVIYGLRGAQIDARGFPNQGTWNAVGNATLIGLCLGAGGGLLYGWIYGPVNGLLFGLRLGVLAALWYGGYEVIKHFLLRLLLAAGGILPWNLRAMLALAERLRFLHRAGGGFLFANRLLRDYFQQFSESEEPA